MSKDISTFAIGAGAYYGLSFIFAFYPAVVLGVQLCELTWDQGESISYAWGLGGIIAGWFILWLMFSIASVFQSRKLWLSIILIYLLTLHPFIQLILFYMGGGEYEQSIYEAEFPGFDWIPFFF